MWRIREYEEVASTNTLAKELLAAGDVRNGDVLVARHQTAGRGRLGHREWHDSAGQSLLMTVVLERFPLSGAELAQYVCALAVLNALRALVREYAAPLEFRLKWPNDILIGSKKVSGILSEAVWHSNYLKGVVLGIGVNVQQSGFPETLPDATSLRMAGLDVPVSDVRDRVLREFEHQLAELEGVPEHLARMSVIGTLRQELAWLKHAGPLTLHGLRNTPTEGLTYNGITELAFLVLTGKDGELFTTNSGSLEIPGLTKSSNDGAIIR